LLLLTYKLSAVEGAAGGTSSGSFSAIVSGAKGTNTLGGGDTGLIGNGSSLTRELLDIPSSAAVLP